MSFRVYEHFNTGEHENGRKNQMTDGINGRSEPESGPGSGIHPKNMSGWPGFDRSKQIAQKVAPEDVSSEH